MPSVCYITALLSLLMQQDNQLLYSFISPSPPEDFVKDVFLLAVHDILASSGFDDVTVDFFGIYQDENLQ